MGGFVILIAPADAAAAANADGVVGPLTTSGSASTPSPRRTRLNSREAPKGDRGDTHPVGVEAAAAGAAAAAAAAAGGSAIGGGGGGGAAGGVLTEGGGLGPSLTGMLGGQFGATDFGL